MAVAGLSLSILLLAFTSSCIGEEDMKEVVEVRTACLYHKALKFACPENHIVILRSAVYLKGESEGCATDDTNYCQVENIIDSWFFKCYQSNTCEINVATPNVTDGQCSNYKGDPFLKVSYICEAYMGAFYQTNVRDMCDFGKTFSGSLMYLWNPNYPHFSSDQDCGCKVTVDTDVQLHVKVPQFELAEEEYEQVTSAGCNQAIDVQAGFMRQTICSFHDDVFTPVEINQNGDVYIHYRNPELYYARIWMVLQVHYEHNFTLDCKRDFPMPSLPVTTDQSTVVSSTHHNSVPSQHSNKEPLQQSKPMPWPIITAVVAVICVLLVVGISVLLFCRTRLRDKLMKQKGIAETENYRFDSSVYMNHSQVDRHSNRSSESGSQNQVSINMAPSSGRTTNPSRNSNTTISLHSHSPLPQKRDMTLPPIPMNSGCETTADEDVPDIFPAAVLQRLGFQSETMAPEVGDIRGAARAVVEKVENGEGEEGPSRNNSISVKDRAKLINNNAQK